MNIGYIGLGKMGRNMVLRLLEKKWRVVAFNRSPEPVKKVTAQGADPAFTLGELVAKLPRPRVIWIMVPNKAVDQMLGTLLPKLSRGDVVIDGGNSHYTETMLRAKLCQKRGVILLDAGVSGGPKGARTGACVMIGGSKTHFKKNEKLFKDIALKNGYAHFGVSGAGHFVKMVHNGIEYGMMQALAEGFAVMEKSSYKLDLEKVADLYNHGSVIESRLVGWLKKAYREYGRTLRAVSASVAHTGEGEWTVAAAKKLRVPVPIIKAAFDFRVKSKKKPSNTGRILSALRNQFGGHAIKNTE